MTSATQRGPYSAASSTRRWAAGVRLWWTARASVALPVPGSPSSTSHSRVRKAPVDGLAALRPQRARTRPRPGSAGGGDRAGDCSRPAPGRSAGRGATPPTRPPSVKLGLHCTRAVRPLGRSTSSCWRRPGGQRLGDLGQQRPLVGGGEQLAGAVVEHQQVVADGEHGVAVAPAGGEVVVQQRRARAARTAPAASPRCAGSARAAAATIIGPASRRQQVRSTTPSTLRVTGCRIGTPGAGELLQVLDVVLVAEHPRRAAALQRGADAVRADVLARRS